MNPLSMAVAVLHYMRQVDAVPACAGADADFEYAQRRLNRPDVQVDDR
jgi:hypothetical protein